MKTNYPDKMIRSDADKNVETKQSKEEKERQKMLQKRYGV